MPGAWFDFEIVRFTKVEKKLEWMEDEWFEFLKESTLKFCMLEDPFDRNASILKPNNGREILCP